MEKTLQKVSEYVEELIQNDDLTYQEFPVDEAIILRDEKGKLYGDEATKMVGQIQ